MSTWTPDVLAAIDDDRAAVIRTFRDHLRLLVEGDTTALGPTLDDGFTLTHMSGYRQPKQEWIAELRDGQFDYHGFDEKSVDVEVTGDTARLVGRTVADATVYGTHAPWHLELAFDYVRRDDEWIALRAVGTRW